MLDIGYWMLDVGLSLVPPWSRRPQAPVFNMIFALHLQYRGGPLASQGFAVKSPVITGTGIRENSIKEIKSQC